MNLRRQFVVLHILLRILWLTRLTDGQAVNVGSGRATTIREVARLISDALNIQIEPHARGDFRQGEIRHLISDITRIRAAGFAPEVDLETGVGRYLAWIRAQGDIFDYFAAAEPVLRSKGMVRQVRTGH